MSQPFPTINLDVWAVYYHDERIGEVYPDISDASHALAMACREYLTDEMDATQLFVEKVDK